MDPITYLSQVRFHQSIRCSRTNSRVSFALGGEGWDPAVTTSYGRIGKAGTSSSAIAYQHRGPILLYLLPSGCGRLIGMVLEGICRAHNVSILAIDRPGSGATPMCPSKDRIKIATKQTQSVLEALQLDRPGQPQVQLISHSAGWFYALALLEAAPHFFARPGCAARCVFSSPFIPTNLSSSLTLSLLPKGLVALSPRVLPVVSRALGWSTGFGEDILSVSKGLVSWKEADLESNLSQEQQRHELQKLEQKNREMRKRSQQKNPQARFHPPYTSHLNHGLDAWKRPGKPQEDEPRHPKTNRKLTSGGDLLFDYFIEEGSIAGMTEDYLLCLGKATGFDNEELTRLVLRGLEAAFCASKSTSRESAELVVLWGSEDFMIPRKGRVWLDTALNESKISDSIRYQRWDMAEGGHDATLFSEEVMIDVLDFFVGGAKQTASSS